MHFELDEITDHRQFEDLAVSYFEDIKNEQGHNIVDIDVKPSGTGTDGGRDILVTLKVTDSIVTFERRWIVQCKFHNSDISTDKISDINIPVLLNSYRASGYLLICRRKPTSKLTDLFERLESASDGLKFLVWSGEQFKRLILVKSKRQILQQYFPKYFDYCVKSRIFE
jgi:predicted helicase